MNQRVEIPSWYSVPPNRFEFVVSNPIIFAINPINYQVLSNLKMSCGSVLTIPASTHKDLFIEDRLIFDIRIAATGGRVTGVDLVHLSKVWSIDLKAAECMIEVTTQLKQHNADGGLSRNFSTND